MPLYVYEDYFNALEYSIVHKAVSATIMGPSIFIVLWQRLKTQGLISKTWVVPLCNNASFIRVAMDSVIVDALCKVMSHRSSFLQVHPPAT